MWTIAFAFAQETGKTTGEPGTGGFPGSFLMMIIAMFAIMYFFMMRPQQKREKERREMLARVSKGDRVVTTGGICGTIVGLTDKTVVLRVDDEDNVKIEFLRGAIAQVTAQESSE